MKSATIILLCFFVFAFAKGQTYSSEISDKEIYDFLNWMTKNSGRNYEEPKLSMKHISYFIMSWDTANFIAKDTALIKKYPYMDMQYIYRHEEGLDTMFSQYDRDYLFKQFTSIKDTIWHNKFSNSTLHFKRKQVRVNIYYYSIPLFSADKNYVIVRQNYYCGSLCANGGYHVFRWLGGKKKWEYVTSVNTWMS
jgi:hypothetical protein